MGSCLLLLVSLFPVLWGWTAECEGQSRRNLPAAMRRGMLFFLVEITEPVNLSVRKNEQILLEMSKLTHLCFLLGWVT